MRSAASESGTLRAGAEFPSLRENTKEVVRCLRRPPYSRRKTSACRRRLLFKREIDKLLNHLARVPVQIGRVETSQEAFNVVHAR